MRPCFRVSVGGKIQNSALETLQRAVNAVRNFFQKSENATFIDLLKANLMQKSRTALTAR